MIYFGALLDEQERAKRRTSLVFVGSFTTNTLYRSAINPDSPLAIKQAKEDAREWAQKKLEDKKMNYEDYKEERGEEVAEYYREQYED